METEGSLRHIQVPERRKTWHKNIKLNHSQYSMVLFLLKIDIPIAFNNFC